MNNLLLRNQGRVDGRSGRPAIPPRCRASVRFV